MTSERHDLTALLETLSKAQPPPPAKRRARFLQLYHQIEAVVDMNSLSEPEYDKLFSALTAACGFEDPMDALEALADARRKTP